MKKKIVLTAFLCGLAILSAGACAGAGSPTIEPAKDTPVVQIEDVQVSSGGSSNETPESIQERINAGNVDYDAKYADNEAYHYYCEHNPDKLADNEEFKNKLQQTLTYEDVEKISNENETFLGFFKALQDIQFSAYVDYDSESNSDLPGFNHPGGFTLTYHVSKKDGTPVMVNVGFGYVICSAEGTDEAPVILSKTFSVES